MNREDVIRMAREAGAIFDNDDALEEAWQQVERFAALVAAAEREACAQEAERYAAHQLTWRDEPSEMRAMGANEAAEAIRARGQG